MQSAPWRMAIPPTLTLRCRDPCECVTDRCLVTRTCTLVQGPGQRLKCRDGSLPTVRRRRYQVCTCATFSPDIVYECSSQGHEDIHVRPACFNVSSDVHKDRCSRIEMQLGSLGVHEQNGGDYGGRRYCTAPCRSRLELELTGASMHRGRLATMMTKLPPWRRQANRHRPEPNERCWPKRLCGPTATGE